MPIHLYDYQRLRELLALACSSWLVEDKMNGHATDPRSIITLDPNHSLCASVAGIPWRGFAKEQAKLETVLDAALGLMRDQKIGQALALFATI